MLVDQLILLCPIWIKVTKEKIRICGNWHKLWILITIGFIVFVGLILAAEIGTKYCQDIQS